MSYSAIVAPVTVRKHPNADRLQLGVVSGHQVVVERFARVRRPEWVPEQVIPAHEVEEFHWECDSLLEPEE